MAAASPPQVRHVESELARERSAERLKMFSSAGGRRSRAEEALLAYLSEGLRKEFSKLHKLRNRPSKYGLSELQSSGRMPS